MRFIPATALGAFQQSAAVAFLWLALSPAVEAQQCPEDGSAEWPTREWRVRCDQALVDQMEARDLLLTNEAFEGTECDDTSTTGVAAATRSGLEEASVWLESLCFRSPDVPTDERNGRPANLAWVSENVHIRKGKPNTLGVYKDGNLYMDLLYYFALGDGEGADGVSHERRVSKTSSMVHELFHAIQARYPIWKGSKPKWITESMAVAVQIAWLHRTGVTDATTADRFYDFPLHKADSLVNLYRTHSWWLWLGEALRSPDRVGYLADLLIEPSFDAHQGLSDLEIWLRERDLSLYELYPRFIADFATESSQYSNLHSERIRYRDERIVEEEHDGRVREMAAEAVRLQVDVPPGQSAELTIRIRPDQEPLHLAVGRTNFSTPDGSMTIDATANLYRWDKRDPAWAEARNTFRTVIVGGESPREFLTRVTNVEREPVATAPSDFRLEFELKPFGECQFSASMSGDTTSTSATGRVAQFSTRGGATSTGLLSNPGNAEGMAALLEQFAGDRITDEERAELRAGAEQWQREAAQMPTETLGINLIEMDPGAGGASNLASALGGFRLSASVFDQPIEPGFRGVLEPGLLIVQTGQFDEGMTAQTRFEWAPGEPGGASIRVTDYQDDQLAGTINAVLEAAGVRNPDTGEPLRIQISANFLARRHDPLGGLIACLPGT